MRILLKPTLHMTTLDGGGLVIVAPAGTVFRGNGTTADMCAALAASDGNIDQAAEALALQHRQPVDRIRADIENLTRKLRVADLVTVSP